MRIQLLVLFLILAGATLAQELGPPTPTPAGVRYKEPTKEQVQKSLEHLRNLLKPDGPPLEEPTLVGPLLSHTLVGVKGGEIIPATMVIPRREGDIQSTGSLFRGSESLGLLLKSLRKMSKEGVKIRRPSKVELEYYWALAPYDLEGPILVVETSKHHLFWNFAAQGLIYLEDVKGIGPSLESAYNSLAKLPKTQVEPKFHPDYIKAIEQGRPVPEPLKGVQNSKEPMLVLLTGDQQIKRRVKIEPLADYMKSLQAVTKSQFQGQKRIVLLQVDLVAGSSPVLRVGSPQALSGVDREAFLKALKAVPAPPVGGPVAFFMVEKFPSQK